MPRTARRSPPTPTAAPIPTTAPTPTTRLPAPVMGPRARATRLAILDAAKQLFLERGYAGTRIENITDLAGISKAGFYTYFPSKRDVFLTLGEHIYRDISEVIDAFAEVPDPATREGIERWVARHWAFMEQSGAFILVAVNTGPSDPELREVAHAVQLRAARHLGRQLLARQAEPRRDGTALGLAVLAMLERFWFFPRVVGLDTDERELRAAQCDLIESLLGPR